MFLNVREMELRKVCFEETFPPGEIHFLETKLSQAGPLTTAGTAELLPSTKGEIRIQGTLQVRIAAECDRCLDVTDRDLDLKFDLFYAPLSSGPHSPEVRLDKDESETDFYEGDGIELEAVLREQILLAMPMQRICREDCQGICPICGQNRNRVACGCRVKAPDDRWAALRKL
jgi:uncharacterized protein